MTPFKRYLLIILGLFWWHTAIAETGIWPKEKALWKVYNAAVNDVEKFHGLYALANYYEIYLDDVHATDTLIGHAISRAELTMNSTLMLKAYELYFDRLVEHSEEFNKKYLNKTYALATKGEATALWYWHYFQAKIAFEKHNYEECIKWAKKAEEEAEKLNNTNFRITSLIISANSKQFNRDKIAALNSYLEALDLVNESVDLNIHYEVLHAIQYFYLLNDNKEMSKKYIDKQTALLNSQETIDTLLQLNLIYAQSNHKYNNGETEDIAKNMVELLHLTKTKGYLAQHKMFWTMWRSVLISASDFEKLHQLYVEDFPEELAAVKNENPELYHRLQAYFLEYEGNIDSSQYYWNIVMKELKDEHNFFIKAHLHIRYTEFLFRNKKYEQALEAAQQSLKVSERSQFDQFQITSATLLAEIQEKLGDYENAIKTLKHKNVLELEANNNAERERLSLLEVQHEYDQKELVRKNEAEKIESRAKTRYTILISGVFLLLIVSLVIFRLYRVTRHEKERSDGLLLNILPEDTAQELKEFGTTTARQFQNVTVLFCDIVGFTKIAENLTPQELVKEIDAYFRAFDKIITEHGMEKIKTVGDAYVAVGGMPQKNKATVVDVANAALAMQAKVQDLAKLRANMARPAFELRVGLNTGPVVAGVVGSKKFQYDIWGDTVNIAARMEQNCIPGKINISEATHSLIENDFCFEYRGKIDAKNKGKIAMYFLLSKTKVKLA